MRLHTIGEITKNDIIPSQFKYQNNYDLRDKEIDQMLLNNSADSSMNESNYM